MKRNESQMQNKDKLQLSVMRHKSTRKKNKKKNHKKCNEREVYREEDLNCSSI